MKQVSKVLAFGENFCSGAYGISGNKTDKAPFDKTYPAIILGVNQKFTDDVSENEQSKIIEKFSIPETVEEGGDNYYTFKINGAYYCKRQNGDFKLYDNVMVYIPNGDWSNMYFDYPDASSHGGGGGGGSGTEHQLIVSVDAPGGAEPKLGDMWLFVRNENKTTFDELTPEDYTNMYTWQEDKDTGAQSWKSTNCTVGGDNPPSGGVAGDLWIKLEDDLFSKIYLCMANGSSIVWSEVYPNDETGVGYSLYISADKPLSENDIWVQIEDEEIRQILAFYQYQYNSSTRKFEWTLGGVDIAGGSGGVGENVGNHNERFNGYTAEDGCAITGASEHDYNHAEGYKNSLTACQRTHIEGTENTARLLESSLIYGRDNVVTPNTSGNGAGCLVGGFNNEIRSAISGSIVEGTYNHILADTTHSLVAGTGNRIVGQTFASVVAGQLNTLVAGAHSSTSCSLVVGSDHVCDLDHGIVFGIGANTTSITAPAGWYAMVLGGGGTDNNVFAMTNHGDLYAAGGYNSLGADYAEYFEWADGNPDNEDRRGMLVALDGDRIVPASGNGFLGVISANPSVVGNSAVLNWEGKYKRDVFGCMVRDENGEPVLNPDYDPEKKYIPREQRPEWAAVGLVGRLVVTDDGSCKTGGYCTAKNGTASYSKSATRARVLKRIDDTHVEVFIK